MATRITPKLKTSDFLMNLPLPAKFPLDEDGDGLTFVGQAFAHLVEARFIFPVFLKQ